jgi:hypothetical protein
MADLRISELAALSGANLAANDLLAVVDSSASETKKITVTDLVGNGTTLIADATIPGAKILFGSGQIPGGALVNGAVGSDQIASGAVHASKLAANSTAQLVGSLPPTGGYVGQLAVDTNTNKAYVWNGSTWISFKAAGSINQLVATTAGPIQISVSTVGDVATLSVNPQNTPTGGIFLAGPAGSGGAVSGRAIVGTDLPTASNVAKGGVIVNGEGLRIDGDTIEIDSDVSATATYSVVTHTAKGLITASRAITEADLPAATAGAKGAVFPGTGLSVTGAGALNHTNAVTSGTATKVSFDSQGHITSTSSLLAADIPDLPAEKLTTGVLSGSVFGTNSIAGSKLEDFSITKFGGASSTAGIVPFPTADFTGQYFFDSLNGDLYLWDGSAWQPVTITSGELVFAGTYNASTNLVASVTTAGSGAGLTAGSALPAASTQNNRYYLVVTNSGTGSGNAPAVSLQAPDHLLSNGGAGGTTWQWIDVSGTIAAQTASNITFTPGGGLASANVQAALEELDTEKLNKTGGTITGNLEIGTAGSLTWEGSTADANETTLTVVNPTADRTITLPDRTGTVITSGDTGTVTNTMLAGSIAYSKLSLTGTIVNADVSAGAAIAYSKLNLAGSIANADVATGAAIAYTKLNLTGSIVNGDIASNQITYDKLVLSPGGVGTIVNADISASAAIADTKLNTISTAGKVSGGAITSGTIGGSTAINTSGTITTTGVITDGTGNIRRIPQNAKTAAYVLAASDVGKHISITTGGVTVPASIFQIGDNVTIFNNSTSNQTITQGSGVTLRAGGSTATGNRTLANYGVATVLCVAADVFVITGTGLT